MKKLLFTFLISALSISAFSQEKGTNEIQVGVGFATSNDLLSSVEDLLSDVSLQNTTTAPAFTIAYKHAIGDRWFLFADGAFQTFKSDVVENSIRTGDLSRRYLTVGFGTDYHYISSDWLQIYSGVSIAYTSEYSDFTTSSNIEDKNDSFFNFQINAVGLRVGKAIAATVEVGYGYKGIANVGLSYQF